MHRKKVNEFSRLSQQSLYSLEVVQHPLCVQHVMHGDHVVLLTHDTRAHTTQLLWQDKQQKPAQQPAQHKQGFRQDA